MAKLLRGWSAILWQARPRAHRRGNHYNAGMVEQITITRPDDWHLHLRDGDALRAVLPDTARRFARAIVMPNLSPPVRTLDDARTYIANGPMADKSPSTSAILKKRDEVIERLSPRSQWTVRCAMRRAVLGAC